MRIWWHPLRSLFFLSHFADSLPWDGPLPTVNALRPTNIDKIRLEPTPVVELVKRDNATGAIGLCGFINQLSSSIVDCNPHSTCFWNTDYSAVGCCLNAATTSTCRMYTSCYASSDINTNCESSCTSNSLELQWYIYTSLRSDSA
jgi:hypothetical protein